MNTLDPVLTAAAVLLWLEAVGMAAVLIAAPFVGWRALRQRRKAVEDFDRRHAEFVAGMGRGARPALKRFKP